MRQRKFIMKKRLYILFTQMFGIASRYVEVKARVSACTFAKQEFCFFRDVVRRLRRTRILFIVIILNGLISCGDQYIPYSLIIDNKTNDTITIFDKKFNNLFTINPNVKDLFFKTNIRLIYNYDCDPKIQEDDFLISTQSGRKLIKNMWIASNWICIGSDKNGWELTFIINEEDLQYE